MQNKKYIKNKNISIYILYVKHSFHVAYCLRFPLLERHHEGRIFLLFQ